MIGSPLSRVNFILFFYVPVHRGETRPGGENRVRRSPGEPAGQIRVDQTLDREDHEADGGYTAAQSQ